MNIGVHYDTQSPQNIDDWCHCIGPARPGRAVSRVESREVLLGVMSFTKLQLWQRAASGWGPVGIVFYCTIRIQ
jgi:hypothetical protein